MADNSENFTLSVELDAGKSSERLLEMVRTIDDLKKAQKELSQEYKDGKISAEQYAAETARVNQQLQHAKRQQNNLAAAVNAATTKNKEYATSLDGMREKLADMQKAYATLDEEQRKSKAGKEFLKQIQEQDAAVKGLEKSMGDGRRSVGLYEEALKGAGVGVDGLKTKLLKLIKNPWAILFTTIATAVKTLADAFRRSEETTNKLRTAFAPFKGILDVVTQAVDKLAGKVADVLVAVLDKALSGLKNILAGIDRLAKLAGWDWNLSAAFADAADNVAKLEKAEQQYEKSARAWLVERARLEKEQAAAEADFADKANASTEERTAALDKLEEVQRKIVDGDVRLAKERLRVLQLDAQRAENDAAANDAIAQAKADVLRAEKEAETFRRDAAKKRTELLKEEKAETAANQREEEKNARDKKKLDEEELKRKKSELDLKLQMQTQMLDADALLTEEAYKVYEEYYAELLALYEGDEIKYNETLLKKLQYEKEYNDKVKKHAEELTKKEAEEAKKRAAAIGSAVGSTLSGAQAVFGALEDLAEKDTENDEDLARRKKGLAIATLLVDQAQAASAAAVATVNAIEGATKAAAATGAAAPFTTPVFIAEMVGIVGAAVASAISGIIQAKNLISGAYQSGGVIGGYTSTPSPVDNTYARVASGEMVLNAGQQRRLFELANGDAMGANIDAMAAAMAAAVAALPAPVMDYTEFRQFGQRVAEFDEVARI